MTKKIKLDSDSSTEEKIKEAAHVVFRKKGFSATRTRDIAEEAGINLALLNYYFRSKERLFDIVMRESILQFLDGIKGILNNENITLTEKVTAVADNYINLLNHHPELPLFILSEIKSNPEKLATDMNVKEIIIRSHLYKQIQEATDNKINPIHFIMNIISVTVFPFVASPLLQIIGDLKHSDFSVLMEERKKWIPLWVDAMLKVH